MARKKTSKQRTSDSSPGLYDVRLGKSYTGPSDVRFSVPNGPAFDLRPGSTATVVLTADHVGQLRAMGLDCSIAEPADTALAFEPLTSDDDNPAASTEEQTDGDS